MRRLSPFALIAALLALGGLSAAAQGANGSVRLAAHDFTVGEGDGFATIGVERSTGNGAGEVRYAVWHRSADYRLDYTPVRGRLDFADGQTQASFRVPIVDDANVEGRETIAVGIYGAYPQAVGEPKRATLTILDNDTVSDQRDALNPLGLDPPPPPGSPLIGAPLFTNPGQNLAGTVIKQIRHRRPDAAQLLQTIADQPETKRFGAFNDQPGAAVAQYLAQAQALQPGSVPLIATYRFKHTQCGGYGDTRAEADRYKRWYEKFAQGIGNHRAIVFMEIDALITMKCLSRHGERVRASELRSAIASMAAVPRAVVYVDAGAADAHNPRYIAARLRRIGVYRIQGFFTNSTHQDWTSREIEYGRRLVRQLGGRPHYVVNTATNGRGPVRPKNRVLHGNTFHCNPPGAGLGPRPTTLVPGEHRHVDGLFWIGNPGRSAGDCSKTPNPPPAGMFWVDYAVALVRHADFSIR
ncbi:MAG TPA: glycoside hydrolase family 6 protein [Conexibacter sp.]|nr:glycoside hydrolase family 6 protein [Conexibacter sp.]